MQWKTGFSEVDASLALADGPNGEDSGLARDISAILGTIERNEHVGARGEGLFSGMEHGRGNTKQSYRLSSLLRHGV